MNNIIPERLRSKNCSLGPTIYKKVNFVIDSISENICESRKMGNICLVLYCANCLEFNLGIMLLA